MDEVINDVIRVLKEYPSISVKEVIEIAREWIRLV